MISPSIPEAFWVTMQMRAVIVARDVEIAKQAKLMAQRRKEMRQLCLLQRREGVNMEYLKNVVVQ